MAVISRIGELIKCLFEDHKLVRRSLLLWSSLEVHWTLEAYRANMGHVEAADATIIVSTVGLIGTVLGAGYLWTRANE